MTWTGLTLTGADYENRDCGDWVDTNVSGSFGSLEEKARNFAHNTTACSVPYRVYCAEE